MSWSLDFGILLTGADSNVPGWDAFNPLNIRWAKKPGKPHPPPRSRRQGRAPLALELRVPLAGFRYKYHPGTVDECQCQSKLFNVTKIARSILYSPRRCDRVTVLYKEMTDENVL